MNTDKKNRFSLFVCGSLLILLSAASVWFFYSHHFLLYYGDAEAHLNIARRVVESQTPGYLQLGSPWLPLPHALMLPFVANDALWRSGLAGAIPNAFCFVCAGLFLFAAARRIFASPAAAMAATALFALNPNLLYLQSIPMSECVFFASLMALLYCTVRFRQTQGLGAAAGAGAAALLATLSRYEGWVLLPFTALYLVFAARRRRWQAALLFSAIAGIGPLYWLAHNWYLTGDPLWFLTGPYSAQAIQGGRPYAGKDNWRLALLYVRTAAQLDAGPGLWIVGSAGVLAAIWRRAIWPLLFLTLTPLFYVWSMHSSGLPIHVPVLWPHSYYNTRYGLCLLPLLAVCAGALVTLTPRRARGWFALLVVAAGSIHWLVHPEPRNWLTWEESRVNSQGRRAWTAEAAAYLKPRFVSGSGIVTTFGDITGIYREMGIPLRETFTECDGIPWNAAVTRPDLFLWHEWAVVRRGDPVYAAVTGRARSQYSLVKTIMEKDEPVIEIYHRGSGDKNGSS